MAWKHYESLISALSRLPIKPYEAWHFTVQDKWSDVQEGIRFACTILGKTHTVGDFV